MFILFKQRFVFLCAINVLIVTSYPAMGEGGTQPRVVIPTGGNAPRPAASSPRVVYPWKTYVTATIFWCGEQPTERNPTPNCKSSWDTQWSKNFGGYDDPDPKKRIACHKTGVFRPKDFEPKLNPFYIALPYNDVLNWKTHKPEAPKVIPWFSKIKPEPGKTVLKGRWLQIYVNKKSCFAQWEDCGPWVTTDWEYVFGKDKPKATENGSAGIDLSPSVRDYLGVKSGDKVHWRFVDEGQVPQGPWKKFGNDKPATHLAGGASKGKSVENIRSDEADRKYIENLRKMRDQQFMNKPLSEL